LQLQKDIGLVLVVWVEQLVEVELAAGIQLVLQVGQVDLDLLEHHL
jgi:hypothetical protein